MKTIVTFILVAFLLAGFTNTPELLGVDNTLLVETAREYAQEALVLISKIKFQF